MPHVYEVEWSDAAAEDLFAKVNSHDVAEELVRVSREALELPPSKDGGRLGPYLWRRGLTSRRRAELDAAETHGEDLDTPEEHPWDYVLLYRGRGVLKSGFRVLAVLTNGEIGAGICELPVNDTVPVFD